MHMPGRMMNPELERLKLLQKQAHEALVTAETQRAEQQLNISKDAAGHFEKLAVFCGGTIALVISFLGGHREVPMHWHVLIPISIWILTGGMIAATARNIIHQHWAHRIFERASLQARREEQAARYECMAATPTAVSMQSGEKITAETLAKMKQSTEEVDVLLNEWGAKEKSLLNWWIRSGQLAQVLALSGILCLAVLATKNV